MEQLLWMLLLFFETPSQTWQGVVTLNEHVQAQSFSVFSTRFSGLYKNIQKKTLQEKELKTSTPDFSLELD